MGPRGKMYYYPSFYPFLFNRKNIPPITMLVSALGNAPPNEHRKMLGVHLYPLVDQLEHENVAKVTGMLLEMGTTEVLHLLESPDDLKLMVAETMDVLRNGREDAAIQQQTSITALPSTLANAPPHRHRVMLGEKLYPLVFQLEHQHTDLVTEMILEMDTTEVLYLLDSPVALKFMVAQLLDALKNFRKHGSLSVNYFHECFLVKNGDFDC